MTSRREFLQTAAALSAAPLAGRAAFARGHEPLALRAAVFDARHAEARAFGAHADRLGAAPRAIVGDITDLWRGELLPQWKAGPAAVAGLTERPALFLLERLAWDHGLRVVYEAEHVPDARGFTVHKVLRSADPELARALEDAGPGWPAALADALIAGTAAPARERGPTDAGLVARLDEPATLCSWIIAPRSAAERGI